MNSVHVVKLTVDIEDIRKLDFAFKVIAHLSPDTYIFETLMINNVSIDYVTVVIH